MGFTGETPQQCRCEPGLANASLARQQHDLTFAGLGFGPASKQQVHFVFPPNQSAQVPSVQRLEPALYRTWPQHSPDPHRFGDTLELLWAKVGKIEKIAEKPTC